MTKPFRWDASNTRSELGADALAPTGPDPSDGQADKGARTDRILALVSILLAVAGIIISAAGLPWSRLVYLVPAFVATLPGSIYFLFPDIRKWKYWNPILMLIATMALLIAAIALILARPQPRCCVPAPTVVIVTPKSTLDCRKSGPQCQFTADGRSKGVTSDLQIFVLVFPVQPPGGGWFVQSPPAGIGGNGDWSQSPSYIGSPQSPAHGGDTLEIEAIVVRAGATYNGTLLSDLPSQGRSIYDPRQINGLVGQSNIVSLQVRR